LKTFSRTAGAGSRCATDWANACAAAGSARASTFSRETAMTFSRVRSS